MMNATQDDYYALLGISRNASASEIKKAFRRKAKELHPDTNKDPNAEAQFKDLGEAYSVLSDPQKRQVYDQYGAEGLKGGGFGGGAGGPQSWDFMNDFTDLSDVFNAFFGGGFPGGGRRNRGPARGDDLRTVLEVSFEEAAFGVKKEITVERLANCSHCDGTGAEPGTQPTTCPTCGGRGQVRQTTQTILGHFTQVTVCPQCNGKGHIIASPCQHCDGQGREAKTDTLTITVPAGVDNGTRLRVSGEGDAGAPGGPPGDLYVVIQVKEHAHFERDGYELLCRVPVCFTQLALGDSIELPLLSKPDEEPKSETVKVTAGTQSGHVLILRGQGIPYINNPNQRGDLHAVLEVQVPKKLDSEEKHLLQELQALQHSKLKKHREANDHPSFFSRLKDILSGSAG